MRIVLIGLTIFLMTNCYPPGRMQDAEQLLFQQETRRWQEERLADLLQPNSWLDLVGLHWLEEGENTFGSDSRNDHRFPSSTPSLIGNYTKNNDSITLAIAPDIEVLSADGKRFARGQLYPSERTAPVILQFGTVSWFLIERAGSYGIRVRDTESAARNNFAGLTYYPADLRWRVVADFIPVTKHNTVLENVLGTASNLETVGQLQFVINKEKQTLDVFAGEEDTLFLIIADATTGETTYGGGRYLYVNKPDQNNRTVVDFNRAYNPPCVFTDYATCPLPPPQNFMGVAITAGEKKNK